MDEQEFLLEDGIKIYTGASYRDKSQYIENIKYMKSLLGKEKIFTDPVPSTLTAQGFIANITFVEDTLINILEPPTGNIIKIGCNYGELFNPQYVTAPVVKKSGRGRKPKVKLPTKRRVQGNGKYFASQITFVVIHPKSKVQYQIKLFRNGKFQVPGIKKPNMTDLIEPIKILETYLKKYFPDAYVISFNAVMRNYKSGLLNESLYVDLNALEEVIDEYKNPEVFDSYVHYITRGIDSKYTDKLSSFIGKSNQLNIAEVIYSNDKYFCLNIKFYRPNPNDPDKKITVKLLKKGKINFDGGNSEYEMLELYYWLEYVYAQNKDKILVDIKKIQNEYHEKTSVANSIEELEAMLEYSDVDNSDESDNNISDYESE